MRGLRASTKDPHGPGRIWTAGEPESDAFADRTAQGGFFVPPALQEHMVALRASKLSDEMRARFTPFPFETDA